MVDFENDVGPIRQIPGTQNTRDPPPGIDDEPEWMKLSTVMGLKAGGVIFRDLRAWVRSHLPPTSSMSTSVVSRATAAVYY